MRNKRGIRRYRKTGVLLAEDTAHQWLQEVINAVPNKDVRATVDVTLQFALRYVNLMAEKQGLPNPQEYANRYFYSVHVLPDDFEVSNVMEADYSPEDSQNGKSEV